MIVDSSEESGGGIFSEAGLDESSSSWVLIDEGGDVVNETGDDDELASLASFGEVVPGEDGKIVRRLGPVDLIGLLLKGLHLHGDLSSTDLVIGYMRKRDRQEMHLAKGEKSKLTESLELRSETELVGDEDEPLGRVVCKREEWEGRREGRAKGKK